MPAEPEIFLERMQTLARLALQRWDLDVSGLAALKVRENAVFRVDLRGGGRAVLRVHRDGYHSDAALDSEFAWLRALESAGIQVPRVIRSRHARDFEVVGAANPDGARQVDVFEWIDGCQLGSIESGVGGGDTDIAGPYFKIGVIAARMHNHASHWRHPQSFRRHAWDAAGLVGERPLWGRFWELAALTDAQRTLLIRARAMIAGDLEDMGTHAAHYGLIHADLVPENVLVDGDRVCVIDFDDAGFGWHLFEMATSLYFVGGDVFESARDALLRGYRSERPLSDAAIDRLPLFLAARGTTYLGWVHTRQGTETARELTPFLIQRACTAAEQYLGQR